MSTAPYAEAMPLSDHEALRQLCFADPVFSERYRGWKVLGRGSWATVVKTHSRDAGHDIALKIFVNLEPELLERVRHEVRAAQALATPQLVHPYSVFERGSIAWFEMELVEGPNLQDELNRLMTTGERLPIIRAYEIALAVSRCLWYAHRHGVLHRDIKPANVLLPSLGRPAAKLSDFGIARLADASSATPPGAITGTPRFASPEALAGEPVDARHDIYGLGVTLYALFSGGRLPHTVSGDTTIAALRVLRRAAPPDPLGPLAPELDRRVERVVMQALAPDPSRRPPPRQIVLALERAEARAVATVGRRQAGANVSVSSWKVAIAALGLLSLSIWTGLKGRRRAAGETPR